MRASDLRAVEELIDEHFPFECNVLRIDTDTWAIHGSIPVGGEVILAEFSAKEGAEAALDLLSAAGANHVGEVPATKPLPEPKDTDDERIIDHDGWQYIDD